MIGTIVAVATPFGPGAISVLRVSGPEALQVAGAALGEDLAGVESRRVVRGNVRDGAGAILDDVLVSCFRAPASYTGEDTVEISGHGGVLVTQRVLDRLVACGARVAEAGEFTQRAFLSGKLDLTQAEAVMDVISAQTDLALRAAQQQLRGRLGEATEALRGEMLGIVAHVEAFIDFPEEDIDAATGEELRKQIEECERRCAALLDTAEQGRILREGVRTVIYGEPNVGKSSLLNLLLGYERAIVSEMAGTTRDTVEEVVNLGGIPVRLIDTAGMRETEDEIERHGVERTRKKLAEADLVLEVVDASEAPRALLVAEELGPHYLLVRNKVDLGEHAGWVDKGGVRISCVKVEGGEELVRA
ncbi:MAG: tRNA uridine-5-carboxymethylaminomethyl(34) synthesis GTPase MnmE, partial [Verrucomicrobia bacterium]|nr:tRNA uridine-5-carboxymethylaminomethyl(34) synthesis GTPase MnmE [Verrucomicrobiota bacterium]